MHPYNVYIYIIHLYNIYINTSVSKYIHLCIMTTYIYIYTHTYIHLYNMHI